MTLAIREATYVGERLNPMAFQFKCVTCGQTHTGMPTFGADAPLSYYVIPNDERDHRCASATWFDRVDSPPRFSVAPAEEV